MIQTPVQLFGGTSNFNQGTSTGALTTVQANAGDLVALFVGGGTATSPLSNFADSNSNKWIVTQDFSQSPSNLMLSVIGNTMPINTSFICNVGISTNTYNLDGGWVCPGAGYWWTLDQRVNVNNTGSTSISVTITPRFKNCILWAYVTTNGATGTYTEDPSFTNLVDNGNGGLAYCIVNNPVPTPITYHPTWVTSSGWACQLVSIAVSKP